MQLCQQFPRAVKRPFHLICSEWCSSAVFVSLSPSLNAVADVAVSSTLLAIIVQLARAGMLGRRGFALESTAARICREAGGRVRTNVLVRDMDLPEPGVADARRLEVVVDGLPLRGGAQLAVDVRIAC